MGIAPLVGLFCAFLAVTLGCWGLIAAILPRVRQRAEAAEQEYADRMIDLFMDRQWARYAAWMQYFGAGVLLIVVPILTGHIVLGAAMAAAAYLAPPRLLDHFARKRQQAIEAQLPVVLEMMADATRSGLSLPEAIRLVVSKAQLPLSKEFAVIARALDLGDSVEHTLTVAKDRLRTPNSQLMISALLINQESGGDVARVLDRVSKATRELDQVQRRVESETASVRFSAKAMVATIPLFALILYFMDPSSVAILFVTPIGNLVLAVIVLLAFTGYKMTMKLASPDLI